MRKTASKIRFQKFNLITIVLLFALILAGGIVRSTGSGMGCPDWPKCFGRYIPPTSASQVPKGYQQKYIAKNIAKNQRFANTLDVFGFSDLAKRIREDRSILVPEEFNVAQTWTEYINRLVSVLLGFFLVVTTVFSFSYSGESRLIPVLSVINVLIVIFQGWLGGVVVSTNLVAWVVTVHMMLAMAILAISITTWHLAKVYGKHKLNISPITHVVALLALTVSIVQIVFGTEVREKIDAVSARLQGGYREDWISNAGMIFIQHRDIAILVLIANALLYAMIRHGFNRHSIQQQTMSFTFLMIMLQIVSGIVLSYWSLPPFAQASHVLLATLVFGAQFYLMLNLYRSANMQGGQR
jgi:cytochrome c oxidase assembly protein subunit 15